MEDNCLLYNTMRKSANTKYEIDMVNGPLLGKIIVYALPLMASGILQLTFNAVDLIIVGQYAGSNALAAVGSTSSLINLMVNLFIGLSAGANVLVARFYGGGQKQALKESVHTSVAISIIGGFLLIFVGFFLAKPILTLMDTPPEIIDDAVTYIQIYFAGMPIIMLYNFGSAILRAVGDTRRPLYYLFLAGVLNVGLNVLFVKYLHMGVAGVALGTVLSQVVSTTLLIRALMTSEGAYKLELREIRITKDKLLKMMQIGLPAGIQSSLFSLSNVLIQSSINGFGANVVAGNTAACNIEGLVYTGMNAIYQTALSFVGQNYGAGKLKRIKKISVICIGIVIFTGILLGQTAILFNGPLLKLYGTTGQEIEYGMLRMSIVCKMYFICGIMDVLVGILRGMGYAVMPMIVSLSGACLLRILWIMTVFEHFKSLRVLYLSYPVTWTITASAHIICLIFVFKKLKNVLTNEE